MVKGRNPLRGFGGKALGGWLGGKHFQDFMIILDPESIVTKSQTAIQGVRMNSRLILKLS